MRDTRLPYSPSKALGRKPNSATREAERRAIRLHRRNRTGLLGPSLGRGRGDDASAATARDDLTEKDEAPKIARLGYSSPPFSRPLSSVSSFLVRTGGPSPEVIRDGGTDRRVVVEAASADANEEPASLVTCASTFEVSVDCTHPAVTEDCDSRSCRIPKGCSVMGSPPCENGRGAYDEGEVQVRLTHDFEIAAHETTQAAMAGRGLRESVGYGRCTFGLRISGSSRRQHDVVRRPLVRKPGFRDASAASGSERLGLARP